MPDPIEQHPNRTYPGTEAQKNPAPTNAKPIPVGPHLDKDGHPVQPKPVYPDPVTIHNEGTK